MFRRTLPLLRSQCQHLFSFPRPGPDIRLHFSGRKKEQTGNGRSLAYLLSFGLVAAAAAKEVTKDATEESKTCDISIHWESDCQSTIDKNVTFFNIKLIGNMFLFVSSL